MSLLLTHCDPLEKNERDLGQSYRHTYCKYPHLHYILQSMTFSFISYLSYELHCWALPDKRCLSHSMLPLSGHNDIALFE